MSKHEEITAVLEGLQRLGPDTVKRAKRAAASYDLATLAYMVNMARGHSRAVYIKISFLCALSCVLLD